MNSTLKTIVDIISVPAILVALIALLGLLLQKKPTSETIKGTIKTFIGFLVITAGAGIVEKSLTPFSQMFIHAFNVQGVVPNNEAIVSIALTKLGSLTALIMFAGMIINILIARFSQLKYIYLTGHAMLYMSCMFAVILDGIGVDFLLSILLGGLALGLSNTLFPALAQPFMKDITQNESVALGHTGDAGYALSGFIGKLINKKGKSKSTEDISFPKSLSFLRDSSVAIALTMSIVYIIVAIFAGSDFITNELSSGQNFIVYAIIQAGTFAAGIVIILQGVRLILSEIIPAFKGISEKLVPNSIPALDCPIVFPYAPNAVLIGFLSSFVGGIISLFIMIFAGTIIVIPGVVPHFFCGATAGVFGNAKGGVRGAVIGAFVQGIAISFMPIALMPVLGNLGFAGSTFSDTDYGVSGIFLGSLAQRGGIAAVGIGLICVLAAIFIVPRIAIAKKKTA